ncbi:Os05g0353850 [Oryza sativa Japonica Group]|uniref:Os05g0353850 protein n=2 Tax=Oryza sativa subsp. japonica TaxID=39947 RepID=B9FP28_ORYSJ|nr:hypothetical protein OsJ_18187 [Oryza sativa Japonica Group]BAS93556.1 Os05g0353850 [Oryza sativa Japonica Group]
MFLSPQLPAAPCRSPVLTIVVPAGLADREVGSADAGVVQAELRRLRVPRRVSASEHRWHHPWLRLRRCLAFTETTEHWTVGVVEGRAMIRGLRLALACFVERIVVEGDDLVLRR